MKKVNKIGLPLFEVKELDIGRPEKFTRQILDLRTKEDFAKGFKNGSINIPYNDTFVQYAGWFVQYDVPMTVIANPADAVEIQKDLASIGFDQLERIIPIQEAEAIFDDAYEHITPEQFKEIYKEINILDVRTTAEHKVANVQKATHIHYGHLLNSTIPFPKETPLYVHCQSGVRSAIAISALKKLGYNNVINVLSGYNGISTVIK